MARLTQVLWASVLEATPGRLGQRTENGLLGSWVLVAFCLDLLSLLPWPIPGHPSNSSSDLCPILQGAPAWPSLAPYSVFPLPWASPIRFMGPNSNLLLLCLPPWLARPGLSPVTVTSLREGPEQWSPLK